MFLPSGHLQWICTYFSWIRTHFSWIHYPLLQQPPLQLFLQEGACRASHPFPSLHWVAAFMIFNMFKKALDRIRLKMEIHDIWFHHIFSSLLFLSGGIHTPKNTKSQRAFQHDISLPLRARSHSASPFQKICYPFPRCMQVQKTPDELSSPCCEMREENLSPGDQNLSPSPPDLFAAQWCQSNGF